MKKRAYAYLPITYMALAATLLLQACGSGTSSKSEETKDMAAGNTDFKISLAQWSLHRKYFGDIEARGGWEW